jgi:hypothetical protein
MAFLSRPFLSRPFLTMVIASRNGTVNQIPKTCSNACKTAVSAIFQFRMRSRVYVAFIAMLKLLFKFDRS